MTQLPLGTVPTVDSIVKIVYGAMSNPEPLDPELEECRGYSKELGMEWIKHPLFYAVPYQTLNSAPSTNGVK